MNIAIIVSGIYNLALVLFLILKAPTSYFKTHFSIFTIYTSLWIFANAIFITQPSTFLYRTTYAIGAFMPILALMWVLTFEKGKKLPIHILLISYFVALLFSLFCFHENILLKDLLIVPGGIKENYGDFFPLYSTYMGGTFLYLIYKIYKFTRIFSGFKGEQAKYIFIGVLAFGCIALLVSFILPLFGISKYAFFDSASIIIFNTFVVYAITKSHLMDISVIITRLLAWIIATILFGGIYISLVWTYKSFISTQINILFLTLSICFGAIVGQFFNKIRLFLQTTGEKTFLQGKMDFKEAVGEIMQDLAKVVSFDDLDKLLEHIRIEHVESEHLKLLNPDQIDHSLIEELTNKKSPVERNKKIYIPCFSSKGITGILEVGRKLSEDALDQEEIEILELLSSQFSIVLDRIRPYEQIKSELVLEHEKVDKAQKEIEKVSKLATLGTLAAGLAHEIKNPMTVLRSRAERGLNRLEDKDFIKESNELMIKNIDRTLGIVERMLKFGKISGGQGKIKINNAINESLNLLAEKIKDHNILVEKEFVDNDEVLGNLDSLSESFLNLFLNSIEAIQKGGALKIKTSSAKIAGVKNNETDAVKIEIEDSGEGISKENLFRVFDPFFTTRHTGTGLGLSIVQRIILEEHKGSIDIDSNLGKGTRVTILLPK